MPMGRPKIIAKNLPQRMRQKGNHFYHVAAGKWTPLGDDINLARIRWAEIEGVSNVKTFGAALDKYLASSDFAQLAENTRRSYLSKAEQLRKIFGNVMCQTITPAHIYEFMDRHPSRGAANVALNVIKHALERARRAGWIMVNPANDIERHAIKARGRYLTDAEYQSIYQHATDTLRAVMRVAYLTAQRQIDVIKMRLSDITDDGIYVMQQKTGKKQLFTWSDELRDAIRQAKALERPVRGMTLFCTRSGKRYDASNLRSQWATACEKAGVKDAQFRDLRSKAATDAAEIGQDYQGILGHTTKAMSDKYVKRFRVDKIEPLRKKI